MVGNCWVGWGLVKACRELKIRNQTVSSLAFIDKKPFSLYRKGFFCEFYLAGSMADMKLFSRFTVILFSVFCLSPWQVVDAVRHGPSSHRHAANPFSESQCVVNKWPSCIVACPTNSTLPAVMLGKLGASVGKFIATPIQEYPNTSIESCCKACTLYNDIQWNNIFGYVCDYWQWQQVNGFNGACQLFDLKSLCGNNPALATKYMFNTTRTDTVAFPMMCDWLLSQHWNLFAFTPSESPSFFSRWIG